MTRSTGRVKFFKEESGFGFITPDDGGEDVFVHRTDLAFPGDHGVLTLVEGQHVNFERVKTSKGLKAVSVDIQQQQ